MSSFPLQHETDRLLTLSTGRQSLFAYASPFFFIAVAVGWKIFHRSMPPNPSEIDLFDGIDEVEQHEADLAEENTKSAERSTGMRRMFDWVM